MRNLPLGLSLLAAAAAAGCTKDGAGPAKSAGPFWELPAGKFPPPVRPELKLFPRHPRLVFRPADDRGTARTFEDVRRLYREDATFKAIFEKALAVDKKHHNPAMLAALWIVTGKDEFARQALELLAAEKLGKSGEPYYSNVWEHALAYDWLYDHPAMTAERRSSAEAKMLERLGTELAALDDDEMALWHGRNQAANGCLIAALALGDLPDGKGLLKRAAAHYAEALRALDYTQGWPEGASYWIYNRAGPYALGADCLMSATGLEEFEGLGVRKVMRRIGLWQLYQFAPNQVFEPYGDSSGSLRLGETGWWELTTDHYARLSRDPALMAGADYLRNRSPIPYGKRPYYWRIVYTYDPAARPKDAGYDPAKPELFLRGHLPQAMLFGRDSMGVAFFRGNWGDPDETYASFKAGDLLAHHDHYDTGHFSIQRGGLLAPQTGLYGPGGYFGKHRLGYAIQTVSANSLLVLAPGETSGYLKANSKVEWNALSGGQRVMRPTGFSCVSFDHYERQREAGPHLERATIGQFESRPGELDYVAADITAAYNSTRWSEPGSRAKVDLVTRQFLYLRRHDAFVVYDRVETTDPLFTPKWLLHHLAKPIGGEERRLAGEGDDDGIIETSARVLVSRQGRGRLVHLALLPEPARVLKIGGPNWCCYVEENGDQSAGFKGRNLWEGPIPPVGRGAQLGLWRTEVEPAGAGRGKSTRFLNVLYAKPVAEEFRLPDCALVEAGKEAHAVRVEDTVCVFSRSGEPLGKVKLALTEPAATLLLLDAQRGGKYAAAGQAAAASAEGVLRLEKLPAGETVIRSTGR